MNPLSRDRCRQLARLHLECLPDSAVSRLGLRYAEAFYRYVGRSPHEAVFVEVASDDVAGACVVSLRPKNLRWRLLFRTPLLFRLALNVLGTMRVRHEGRRGETPVQGPDPLHASTPELILIFTAPRLRSAGIGTRLLGQCERFLEDRGYSKLGVRTVADPGNRALAFYARSGFAECGRSADRGREFQVLMKTFAGR
jgi:GNAT superfamily N-acetyltransferase